MDRPAATGDEGLPGVIGMANKRVCRNATRGGVEPPPAGTGTVPTGTGFKRSPELVAVDNANAAVRRLRNDLGIDPLSVKRSEAGFRVRKGLNNRLS